MALPSSTAEAIHFFLILKRIFMNFKKIALALAVVSSFAVQAAEPAPLTYLTQFQTDGYAITSAGQTTVYADMNDSTTESNTAYVFQSNGGADAGSVGYVVQAGGFNYAAVIQSGMGSLGYISQAAGTATGGMNKAMITQLETGETARTSGDLDEKASASEMAASELKERSLSLTGNVAFVSQTGGALDSTAVIYQTGTQHFAAIAQEGTSTNFAYVTQTGVGGFAYINQK